MNDQHLSAYCQIASVLTHQAYAQAEFEADFLLSDKRLTDVKKPMYFHNFISTSEWIAQILSKLGILKEVPPFCYFTFECSTEEAASVAERNWQIGPSFDEIISCYVYDFSDFGTQHYGLDFSSNAVFHPKNGMERLIPLLVPLGYAEALGQGFVWTPKIKQIEENVHIWL